jgi:hypothetical protein
MEANNNLLCNWIFDEELPSVDVVTRTSSNPDGDIAVICPKAFPTADQCLPSSTGCDVIQSNAF